ncbi:MAG: thioredoxin family protein [Bacteroidota bacterium]
MNSTSINLPENTFSYLDYIREIETMVKDKKTSGPDQSESLVNYTYLNFKRMSRLNKTIKLDEEILKTMQTLSKGMTWIIITEAWCGDAAQNIPYISKLAGASENIELKLIYRDENPSFMDRYLTNGAKSIPKLICLDRASKEELFVWGPRPEPVQKMVMDNKALPEDQRLAYDEFSKIVHTWYAKDKNTTLRSELLHIFRSIK